MSNETHADSAWTPALMREKAVRDLEWCAKHMGYLTVAPEHACQVLRAVIRGVDADAEIAKLKTENERLSERLAFEMRRSDALSAAQADLINRQTELKAHNAALLAVVKAATGICAKVFISSQEDYDALFVALNAARAAGAME